MISHSSRKRLVKDGLLEGFEVGGLRELKLAQNTDFFRKRIKLLHYLLLSCDKSGVRLSSCEIHSERDADNGDDN